MLNKFVGYSEIAVFNLFSFPLNLDDIYLINFNNILIDCVLVIGIFTSCSDL